MFLQSVYAFEAAGAFVTCVLPGEGPLAKVLRQAGATVDIAVFPVLRKSRLTPHGLTSLAFKTPADLHHLYRLIRSAKPDLIYINTVTIPHWLMAAKLARVRSLCHVHEAEDGISFPVALGLTAPLLLAEKVVANSEETRRHLIRVLPPLQNRLQTVLNGIVTSLPAYVPPPSATRNEALPWQLVLVGRLNPRKGQDVAIKAVRILKDRGIITELTLVGSVFPGYEHYEKELQRLTRSLEVQNHVRFAGFIRDPTSAYQTAHIALVPSRVEPLGNVAIEAMAVGRPVVASRVGGLCEVVTDGVTGSTVPPDDPQALADAVGKLLDPELARSYGQASRKVAIERFSVERYSTELALAVGIPMSGRNGVPGRARA